MFQAKLVQTMQFWRINTFFARPDLCSRKVVEIAQNPVQLIQIEIFGLLKKQVFHRIKIVLLLCQDKCIDSLVYPE